MIMIEGGRTHPSLTNLSQMSSNASFSKTGMRLPLRVPQLPRVVVSLRSAQSATAAVGSRAMAREETKVEARILMSW
jgi:hypothetical protein